MPLDLYGTTRGLTVEDRVLLFLTRARPWLASALMKVSIVNASNARLLRAVVRSFPPADRTVLTEWGPPDARAGLRPRGDAPGHRRAACRTTGSSATPGASPSRRSSVPVADLGGVRRPDRAPRATASSFMRHIRRATVTVVPGEGHLSLLPHQAAGDLRRAARRRPQRRVHGAVERRVGVRASNAWLRELYSPPQFVLGTAPRSASRRRAGSGSGRRAAGCGGRRCRGPAASPER